MTPQPRRDNLPLRVGIIGADNGASWAKQSHVPAIAALPGVTLAAVATRSEASAKTAAAAFGAPLAFGDPLALIHSDAVDIVTVAVRVPAHHALVMAAIAAGKAVYCESPLGSNVAQAEEMALAARTAGVHTAIGLQSRLNPSLRRAAALIAAGAIGRPLTARIVSTSMGFGPAMPATYDYFNRAASGANLSTITAAHTLSALEAVLGAVTDIDARSAILFPTVTLVDTGQTSARESADQLTVLGRVASGCEFVADVNGGIALEDASFRFEVRGSSGWLVLTGGHPFGFQAGDLTLTASVVFDPPASAAAGAGAPPPAINVAEVYAQLALDLRNGTRHSAGFDHAARMVRLIDTVALAARTGARQPFADQGLAGVSP